MSKRTSSLLGAALTLAAVGLCSTALGRPLSPFAPGDPGRHKVHGALPVVLGPRPRADGSRTWLEAVQDVPVVIRFASHLSATDVTDLEALGVLVDRRRHGEPRGHGPFVAAHLTASELPAVAALPRVLEITYDGAPFGAPRPLEGTGAEVQAHDVWRSLDGQGLPITGSGIKICDSDSGIDPFHPMFFRPDGGYFNWVDVDQDGVFSPGVDGIDLQGDGSVLTLRVLNSMITEFWEDTPLFGSDDPSFALGMDWLYADANGNGLRDYGRDAGFDDTSPSFGEALFVVDDVNHNGKLDPDEKLVALGSSKIAAVRVDAKVYRRGENLIDVPVDNDSAHGCGASGVLAGGQRGLSVKVGMAPDADLIMAMQRGSTDMLYSHADFCRDEGARVMLHEYAPWTGYFLDGSSALEQLIDETTLEGMAHINPAGNLSTSQKLYKRSIPASATTDVDIEVPANSGYGRFTLFYATVLWREPSRPLTLTLEDSTGATKVLPTTVDYIYEDWHDGFSIYAERSNSSRGTAKLDIAVFGDANPAPPVPAGTWLLHAAESSAPGSPDLELIAYVMDELSGWGFGINFPDYWSEDHLVGYPGTADRGIGVSAYTGHGFDGGIPGTRASYSGRGHRIDGVALLDVAGPDDPITAGYRKGSEAVYFVYGGTSGASPHVAGVSALLFQAHPDWTGVDVTNALREGALVDGNVGTVPNDDWGYGKLRAYRSLYGQDPPAGSPPTIAVEPTTLYLSTTTSVPVQVSDPDEPASGLRVELDRDYDGVYEETLAGQTLEARFDTLGEYVSKLRVTDSTGREASTLAHFTVVPAPKTNRLLEPAGGCACSLGEQAKRPSAWAAVLGLAALARRRRRSSRDGSAA